MPAIATPAPRKLPVWSTVGACYAAVARNLGQLVRIVWLWLLVMLPVYAALYWLDWQWWQDGAVLGPAALAPVIELPFLASIAVAWHRLLLRQEGVTAPAYLRLDRTVWIYVLYSMLLLLMMWVPTYSVILVAEGTSTMDLMDLPAIDDLGRLLFANFFLFAIMVLLAVLAVGLLVLPRLSLVLPAVALGERLSLRQAWRLARANTLRLALATFLCILPAVLLPTLPVFWWELTVGSQGRIGYVINGVIISLGYAVLIIVGVTLISLTYRFFAAPGGEAVLPVT